MTLRNLILDNFGWKLISLMLALLVWWRVNNLVDTEAAPAPPPTLLPETTYTVTMKLPIRLLVPDRVPRGLAVVPAEVIVTLHGKTTVLEPSNATNAVAYVEALFSPAVRSARLPVRVRPPPGLEVQSINPPEVFVERM